MNHSCRASAGRLVVLGVQVFGCGCKAMVALLGRLPLLQCLLHARSVQLAAIAGIAGVADDIGHAPGHIPDASQQDERDDEVLYVHFYFCANLHSKDSNLSC